MIKNYTFLKYGKLNYEEVNINPEIIEISCTFNNFNKLKNIYNTCYSLHTEYSSSPIKNNTLKKQYPLLFQSQHNNRASLWTSEEWVNEFIDLINNCINSIGKSPTIIEIHPPYIKNKNNKKTELDDFFEIYSLFENEIKKLYKNTIILIENRNCCGDFLLSKADDYINFVQKIQNKNLDLKLIIDIPQLFGKEIFVEKPNTKVEYKKLIDEIFEKLSFNQLPPYIKGLHICGKGHKGDFSSIFNGDQELTKYFLEKFSDFSNLLSDIYIVPEIFNQKDFIRIIEDLRSYKII